MSWKRQDEVWGISGITTGEKIVLLALSHFENTDYGKCCPSLTTLAKATCMSRQGVVNAIVSLERNGFISRKSNMHKGSHTSTSYFFHTKGSQVSCLRSQVSLPGVVKSVDSNREYRTDKITGSATTPPIPPTPKGGGGCTSHASRFSHPVSSGNDSVFSTENTPEPGHLTPNKQETVEKRPLTASASANGKVDRPKPTESATGRQMAVSEHSTKEPTAAKPVPSLLQVLNALDRELGKTYDRSVVSATYQARHDAGWKDENGRQIKDPLAYCRRTAINHPLRNRNDIEPFPSVSQLKVWLRDDNPDGFTNPNAVLAAIFTAHKRFRDYPNERRNLTHGYRQYFNGVARRADNRTIQRIMEG